MQLVQLSDPQGGVPDDSASQSFSEAGGAFRGRSTVEAQTIRKDLPGHGSANVGPTF